MDTDILNSQDGSPDIFGADYDRFAFPADVTRVTAGHGGEALLIMGSKKNALLDCGMAYCGEKTAGNIAAALSERANSSLDYILLTHSHYDHIGALPFIKDRFPQATVCGSEHCRDILKKPGARKTMKALGTAARDLYDAGSMLDIPVDNLEVDIVLAEGDRLELGEETIKVLETKGHTDCSLSFVLEPAWILFASESSGILERTLYVHTPILKSFDDAFATLKKCREYGTHYICLSHFGMLPPDFNDTYWEMFQKSCDEKMDFVQSLKSAGKSKEEMLELYVDRYWTPDKQKEQPREAYVINSRHIIDALLRYIK